MEAPVTILLIDDHTMVLSGVQQMRESLGPRLKGVGLALQALRCHGAASPFSYLRGPTCKLQ